MVDVVVDIDLDVDIIGDCPVSVLLRPAYGDVIVDAVVVIGDGFDLVIIGDVVAVVVIIGNVVAAVVIIGDVVAAVVTVFRPNLAGRLPSLRAVN